jgi:hypothetical protein
LKNVSSGCFHVLSRVCDSFNVCCQVQEDIFKQLQFKRAKSFKVSCFRPNLYYDVVFLEAIEEPILDLGLFLGECLGPTSWDSIPQVSELLYELELHASAVIK